MHRFYLPPEQCSGESFTLTGGEAHHGLRVLRLRRGDQVTVLDGVGGRCFVKSASWTGNTRGFIAGEEIHCRASLSDHFGPGHSQGENHREHYSEGDGTGGRARDSVAFRASHLRLDAEKAESKAAHWRQVAIGAIQTMWVSLLPHIDTPVTPEALLARGKIFDLALIGSLQAGSRHPRKWIEEYRAEHGRLPTSPGVWVVQRVTSPRMKLPQLKVGGHDRSLSAD